MTLSTVPSFGAGVDEFAVMVWLVPTVALTGLTLVELKSTGALAWAELLDSTGALAGAELLERTGALAGAELLKGSTGAEAFDA